VKPAPLIIHSVASNTTLYRYEKLRGGYLGEEANTSHALHPQNITILLLVYVKNGIFPKFKVECQSELNPFSNID